MKETGCRGLSRRAFLKELGAGAGAIGLSPLTSGLIGCGSSDSPSSNDVETTTQVRSNKHVVAGAEVVGKVTADSSTIHLVGGVNCLPSTRFQLFYDTVSHQGEPDAENYAYQSSEVSGFSDRDPIAF